MEYWMGSDEASGERESYYCDHRCFDVTLEHPRTLSFDSPFLETASIVLDGACSREPLKATFWLNAG